MSVSVESVLSMPNSSVGSAKLNVSPYLLDVIAIAVVALAWYTGNGAAQAVGILIAAVLALWAALSAKRFRQFILDTPQSKIGSAAQGFVELQGKCKFYGDRTTQGFMRGPPCVWHRYTIAGLVFPLVKTGESDLPFIVSDETGDCVVNASGARVISSSNRSWFDFGAYHRTKYIRHGAQVYVIGELRTNGCNKSFYSVKTELASVLNYWKQDQEWLLEEFDADKNGELDFEEWENARKRAEPIARDKYEIKRQDHVETAIRKPSNGMPMLISDQHPDKLAVKFRYLGYFNLVVAACCVVAFNYQIFG